MAIDSAYLPGPSVLPLVGARGNLARFLLDPVGYTAGLYRDYGRVCTIAGGHAGAMLFAFGPEYNHQVLSDSELFRSPSFLNFPVPDGSAPQRLDSGLISMNGAQHKQHRRLLQPAFHRRQVEGYRDAMVTTAEHYLERWRTGDQLNLAHEMQMLTLLVASRVLFGLDTEAEAEQLGAMTTRWFELLLAPAVLLAPYDLPGSPYRAMLRHAEVMDTAYRAMIERKRATVEEQHDVLATLIQTRDEDGARLSDAELIGHAHNIFVAGHDSSANTLTWALFLLAQHPQVYADLRDELHGLLRGAAPTLEQLGRLPLLDGVLKETMRLMTPAIMIKRDTTATCEIGGYLVPGGTPVLISPYITHRLSELYPDPERFVPARWFGLDRGPYEYLPFGAGPHMCIGASFAQQEMKLVLALIVQRYAFETVAGTRIDRQVRLFLAPRAGMPLRLLPPDHKPKRVPVSGNVHEMVNLVG
ncbi:MAG: cytochrome P450 [Roseiflexaceae bacterium]